VKGASPTPGTETSMNCPGENERGSEGRSLIVVIDGVSVITSSTSVFTDLYGFLSILHQSSQYAPDVDPAGAGR